MTLKELAARFVPWRPAVPLDKNRHETKPAQPQPSSPESPLTRLQARQDYQKAMRQAVKDVQEGHLTPYEEVRRPR